MSSPTISTKRRLVFMFVFISILSLTMFTRLIFIQIVSGDNLKKQALEQWSRDIPIKEKRGIIYDRNGKILATNISLETVWCRPSDIENPKTSAKRISQILEMEEEKVYKLITKKQSIVEIKRWIDIEQASKLREINISGIEIVDDNKRFYPYGDFASFILGHTNTDNVGQYGVERIYNKYLTGSPGRWMKVVDAKGKEMPYKDENIVMPEQGHSIVLTIDEAIQKFAEKAAYEALVKNKAKKVSIIVMDPNNGDVLAMATKPDYDPNNRNDVLYNPENPWILNSEQEVLDWREKPWSEKESILYDSWKNFPINSQYEPGSTFKIITGVSGLQEGVVTTESQFHCDGFVRQVKSYKPIKCWRYYRPHGTQTFVEGAQNSCNEVFVEIGLRIGPEKMYEYIKKFGFGEKTNISLLGEIKGTIPYSAKAIKEVNLATISFGQGIAVTPIQLVTAISSIANDGNLVEPRIVKSIVDSDGEIFKEFKPIVKRRVVSEDTAHTMLNTLETVVSIGTGKRAYVPGYRVGGKTGTAQKVENGRYANGKYIASFAGIAPIDDPKIVTLVIIDEPTNGIYYGGQIAAPVAGQVIGDTLNYLDVELKFNNDDKNANKLLKVPDIRNTTLKEGAKILDKLGFKYSTETTDVISDNIIVDQFPLPGTKANKGQIIYIYVKEK